MKVQLLRRVAASTLCALLVASQNAVGQGWGFVPTQAEWSAWPMHCRVQYSWVSRGENELARRFGEADIQEWRAIVKEPAFSSLHHYCAAMTYLNKLPLVSDPAERRNLISRAMADAVYTYARTDTESVVYPEVAVTMARVRETNGEREEAIAVLKRAIAAQPQRAEPYGALAMVYRNDKRLDAARDILLEALAALPTDAPEIQYNLGLINLELGDVDAAVTHAQKAYALNYPLPGLRRKLEALRRWQPTAE